MPIPDTSNPPFSKGERKAKQPSDFRKAIKETIGTVTTRILKLGRPRTQGSAAESDKRETDTQVNEFEGSEKIITDADNHYFFEEKALKLNLAVCNKGSESIEDVSIELGFPRPLDFNVADRLYSNPFDKRSSNAANNSGYPEVKCRDDAILVHSRIGVLAPDSPAKVFKCALRLVVGPGMQRRKIAVNYKLRAQNGQRLAKGRLKIKFARVTP